MVKGAGLASGGWPVYLSRLAALRPVLGARWPGASSLTRLRTDLTRECPMPRDKIILACSDCKNRNYFTTKNKRLHPERVEWKKYCPRCNKHVVHKETK
jgi:large subunit ribosomal protein L33